MIVHRNNFFDSPHEHSKKVDNPAVRIPLSTTVMLQPAVWTSPTGRYRIKPFSTVVALHHELTKNDGRHMRGGSFGSVNFGACNNMTHKAIAKSVPFFLSRVQVSSSCTNANVFQLFDMDGKRSEPDRTTEGINASKPRFSSILLRDVVCGITITCRNACQRRTKSCANRNLWAALISTTMSDTGYPMSSARSHHSSRIPVYLPVDIS